MKTFITSTALVSLIFGSASICRAADATTAQPDSAAMATTPPRATLVSPDKGAPTLEVTFESGGTDVPATANAKAKKFAAYAKAHTAAKIEITAHADNTGSGPANTDTAQKRADALKELLTTYGVSADRITAKGYGEVTDKASNSTAAGKQALRRAVATFTK